MKKVEIKTTGLELKKLTGKTTEDGKMADTRDLIEVCLDIIPQGGFTPRDIRERNRIQIVLDKSKEKKPKSEMKSSNDILEFEDHDYDNLRVIVGLSRWVSRDKDLQAFLDTFKEID